MTFGVLHICEFKRSHCSKIIKLLRGFQAFSKSINCVLCPIPQNMLSWFCKGCTQSIWRHESWKRALQLLVQKHLKQLRQNLEFIRAAKRKFEERWNRNKSLHAHWKYRAAVDGWNMCFKVAKSVIVKSYTTDEDVRGLHSEFLMKAKKSLLLKIAIPLLMRQTYLSSAYLSYYLWCLLCHWSLELTWK